MYGWKKAKLISNLSMRTFVGYNTTWWLRPVTRELEQIATIFHEGYLDDNPEMLEKLERRVVKLTTYVEDIWEISNRQMKINPYG